jgi:hypothetical protein
MNRAAAFLFLATALAACGPGAPRPAAPPEPESPEAAACRAEARGAPEVRAVVRQLNAENPQNLARVEDERRAAEIRAFRACMRRRGAALPGGVEPERRQGF